MRILLFRNKNHQAVSKMLRDLWELRKKMLKQIEKTDSQVQQNTDQEDEEIDINNNTLNSA